MIPVLFDFESRSRVDLKTVGGRLYWRHPSTEALCAVWYDTRNGSVGVWTPGQPWPHAGRVLAAHNAHGFDRFGAERYGFDAAGWIDTSQLARKAGLPGALDALGTRWCGVPKDAEGSRFTRALSSVRRPTKRTAGDGAIDAKAWALLDDDTKRERGVLPTLNDAGMARVVRYCASDVAIMDQCWPRLAEWLTVDAEVEALDRIINDRGIAFDHALAQRLIVEDRVVANEACERAAYEMSVANPQGLDVDAATVRRMASSDRQFCEATGCENAQAETVEACSHPLARARKALRSIARGKLLAGIARTSPDGRMRDTLRYYGGHTGRWSGQGMQLHNLPRPAKRFENLPVDSNVPYKINAKGERPVDVDAYGDAVLAGMQADADGIALLVRATLCAPPGMALAAVDFSSVEARATAWAAGDAAAVDVFLSGRDPYKVAASALFGVPYESVDKTRRQIGKVAELACGYGGGPNAFSKMAHTYKLGDALDGLDLRAIVDGWRRLHAPIRDLWYACERAFRSACGGRNAWAGPFEFVRSDDSDAVACFLPSGRPIVYNDPRTDATMLNRGEPTGLLYQGAGDDENRGSLFCPECWRQLPPKTKQCRDHAIAPVLRVALYGGKLVENAIQALCRDLMAQAMLRADAAGLRIVLHVHDEIVVECEAAHAAATLDTLQAAMLALPPWAAGFPIGAEGWTGKRYRK